MNLDDDPFAAPPPPRRSSLSSHHRPRGGNPSPVPPPPLPLPSQGLPQPPSGSDTFLSSHISDNGHVDGLPDAARQGGQSKGQPAKASTVGSMLSQLESLAQMKQAELERAGILGQQILAQQSELQTRIRELSAVEARSGGARRSSAGGASALDDSDGEELGEETRSKLHALGVAVGGWERENQTIWEGMPGASKATSTLPPSISADGLLPLASGYAPSHLFAASPVLPADFSPYPSDAAPASGATTAASRRARNAAPRTNDIEFATEIGQSLLVEVRRLQALLAERDKALEDLAREADDVTALRNVVRDLETSGDKYKEVNWNLEVQLQELKQQAATASSSFAKADNELKRLQRAHADALTSSEAHKNELDRIQLDAEATRAKNDAALALMRKSVAGLERERSDLQGALEKAVKQAGRAGASALGQTPGRRLGMRLGRGELGTPGKRWGAGGAAGEDGEGEGDGEVDEFGMGGGGTGSTRRRGPGFDGQGLMLGADFGSDGGDSPLNSPSKRPDSSDAPSSLEHAQALATASSATAELASAREALAEAQRELAALRDERDWADERAASGAGGGGGSLGAGSRGRRGTGNRGSRGTRGRGGSLARPTLAAALAMAASPMSSPNPSTTSRDPDSDDDDGASAMGTPSRVTPAHLADRHSFLASPSPAVGVGAASPSPSVVSLDPMFAPSPLRDGGAASGGLFSGLDLEDDDEQDDEVAPQASSSTFTPERPSHQQTSAPSLLTPAKFAEQGIDPMSPAPRSPSTSKSIPSLSSGTSPLPLPTPTSSTFSTATATPRPTRTRPAPGPVEADTETETEGEFEDALSTAADTETEGDDTETEADTPYASASDLPSLLAGSSSSSRARRAPPPQTDGESSAAEFHSMGEEDEGEHHSGDDSDASIRASSFLRPRTVSRRAGGAALAAAAAAGAGAGALAAATAAQPTVVERIVEVECIVEVERIVEVEKRVEVPVEVEKIVERIVEVVVEKVVEVQVDRIVEVPVDRIVEVEKRVEVPVEVQVEKRVEVEIEKRVEVERVVEVPVEKIVYFDRPVEVERIVEVPVERIVHVDKVVEVERTVSVDKIVHVDRPVEVERIVEREVEKIVHVDRIVETPVDRIVYVDKIVDRNVDVERVVEVPVERIVYVDKVVEVEKRVEVPVDKIVYVDKEVVVEKTVEVPVERIVHVDRPVEVEKRVDVEKIVYVDKQVEVEKLVEVPVEKIVYVDKLVEVEKRVEVPVEVEKVVYVDKEVERVVEVPVERIVYVDKIVEVERVVEKPVEVQVFVDKIVEVERLVERPVEVERIVYLDRPASGMLLQPSRSLAANGYAPALDSPGLPPVLSEMGLYRYDSSTRLDGLPSRPSYDSESSLPPAMESQATITTKDRPSSSQPFTIPPPPSMAPPLGLPIKKISAPHSPPAPPSRPLSPPPPEIYATARSTTPTSQNHLRASSAHNAKANSSNSSSMLPPIRATVSSKSIRPNGSAGHPPKALSEFGALPSGNGPSLAARSNVRKRADFVINSNASHLSTASSTLSAANARGGGRRPEREPSIASSRSSDAGDLTSSTLPRLSSTAGPASASPSTDPEVVFAITQTMIGEFVHKYTRARMGGKGHSDKRHKRYFYVHPYTLQIYWSNGDPGSTGTRETSATSAFIESVRSVEDPNPSPPGLYRHSIVVSTPQREIKFTTANEERHNVWMRALTYLLSRPGGPSNSAADQTQDPDATFRSTSRGPTSPTTSTRTFNTTFSSSSQQQSQPQHLTPRARSQSALSTAFSVAGGARSATPAGGAGSVSKRGGTAAKEFLQAVERESLRSPSRSLRSRANSYRSGAYNSDDDFERVGQEDADDDDEEEGYGGLEDPRACCDGSHHLGSLTGRNHHHHHQHQHASRSRQPSSSAPRAPSRTGNPSASNVALGADLNDNHLPERSTSPLSFLSRNSRKSSVSERERPRNATLNGR